MQRGIDELDSLLLHQTKTGDNDVIIQKADLLQKNVLLSSLISVCVCVCVIIQLFGFQNVKGCVGEGGRQDKRKGCKWLEV